MTPNDCTFLAGTKRLSVLRGDMGFGNLEKACVIYGMLDFKPRYRFNPVSSP